MLTWETFEDTFLTKEYSTKQWEQDNYANICLMIHFSIISKYFVAYIQKKINKHSFSHRANLQ